MTDTSSMVEIPDDWIEHDGKGMPVSKYERVEIRNAYGEEIAGRANEFEWVHGRDCDIIAYRVVSP